jgi:hypothetical protein
MSQHIMVQPQKMAKVASAPSSNNFIQRATNTYHAPSSLVATPLRETPRGHNFSQMPVYPSISAAVVNDQSLISDHVEISDQAGGPAAPAAPASPPSTPTVDQIDLVNTATGAIGGYPAVTTGDLNTPGPFNNPTTKGVSHSLQVHFHLDNGNSSALTPRREIQRTSTTGGTVSNNPPDRPAPGGVGPPTPGGFTGVLIGPDGPGAHEIQRPSTDKIVIADAPGFAALSASSFPATYKAHFTVTVAAGGADVARINYDVLIEKRSATDVPNTENRSVSTAKEDLVRGRSLP